LTRLYIDVDNYDSLDDGPLASSLGMEQERRDLLKFAYGSVLECGAGTGINLQHYDFANIESLVSVDLSGKMLNQASKKRIDSKGKEISFAIADVEKLPFSDRSFDTIVDTFSLCVYPDPYKAISEMKRVLKDDGQLLLLEHSRSNVPLLGMYQDITAVPIARFGGKGCVWNQNVQQILSDNGLQVSAHDQYLNGLISSFQAHKIL
jgi:methyltransferase OMS1